MVRAHDLAGDARVLYGPLSQRPTPAEAGSGALWVDPSDQTLYHVQSGNWVTISPDAGGGGGGGGAGTPVLYGPYTVDYTDIPHDGDTLTLWMPTVDDVLLRVFVDVRAITEWDHGQLFVGQGVDGTTLPPHNCLVYCSGTLREQGLDTGIFIEYFDDSGTSFATTAYVFKEADPMQIQLAQTGGTDPTQGHVALYALIARAVAP